jgi:hypothetical protein
MPNRATKRGAKRHRAVSPRKQLMQTRRRCPKVSRTRLRIVRDELENTRTALSETVRMYWIISEHDIRGRLAHTEKLIGRVVNVLTKAA